MKPQDRIQFIRLYNQFHSIGYPTHSVETMGNLAFFSERYLFRDGHHDLKTTFHTLLDNAQPKAMRDLCYVVANGIFKQARRERVGENLTYRIGRIQESYQRGRLDHFDVLLDDHDFPSWFLYYKPFLLSPDQDTLFQIIMGEVQRHPQLSFMNSPDIQEAIQRYLTRTGKNLLESFSYLILVELIMQEDIGELEALLIGSDKR